MRACLLASRSKVNRNKLYEGESFKIVAQKIPVEAGIYFMLNKFIYQNIEALTPAVLPTPKPPPELFISPLSEELVVVVVPPDVLLLE